MPPYRFLSIFALLTILALSLAAPGQAFDGRTGEDIVIKADEVVNDDLYIIANNFTLDGVKNGLGCPPINGLRCPLINGRNVPQAAPRFSP